MPPEQIVLWLDMQFSPHIAPWVIKTFKVPAYSSYELSLNTEDDEIIFLKARNAGNVILVTKDRDFPELQQRLGVPPKIIWLRIGNCRNKQLKEIFINKLLLAIEELINTEATIAEIF